MNEKNSKIPLFLGVAGAIIFALYCLFVFVIIDVSKLANPQVFWMSFGFMCGAFAAQLVAPTYMSRKAGLDAVFFGIPIVYLGAFYFFAEMFASTVFMIFPGVGWKAALLVQITALVIFIVAAIVSISAQSHTQQVSEDRRVEATTFKAQVVDVQGLVDDCAGSASGDLKKDLGHLSETIRYSDPFGRQAPSVQEVEGRIAGSMQELKIACGSGETEQARQLIADLEKLFMERRRKLLVVK